MNNLIPIKRLKKAPYHPSTNISCAEHCVMDVALERLFELKSFNALVVGVGECSYYSRKIPFAEGCKNWAYDLTNDEIVFGDMSGISAALEELSQSKNKTVCIFTCIPCLMNFSFDELRAQFPDVIFLAAPDYKGISPYDALDELYCLLFEDAEAGQNDGISIWNWGDDASAVAIREKALSKTHIVYDYHYLRLLSKLSEKYGVAVIDDSRFQPLDYYRTYMSELGLNEGEINGLDRMGEVLRSVGKDVVVKGSCSCDFAAYLSRIGVKISGVITNSRVYNQRTYNILRELPEDAFVCFGKPDETPTNAVVWDFSEYRDEISERQGFERLKFMLSKAEELCRL